MSFCSRKFSAHDLFSSSSVENILQEPAQVSTVKNLIANKPTSNFLQNINICISPFALEMQMNLRGSFSWLFTLLLTDSLATLLRDHLHSTIQSHYLAPGLTYHI